MKIDRATAPDPSATAIAYNPAPMVAHFSIQTLGMMIVAFYCLASPSSAVRGDIYVTTAGDRIEGDLVEDLDKAYRIRTFLGIVDLEKERVEKVIKKTSPWAGYERRRKTIPATADAHYELAQWCKRNKLETEARDELERAIQLDPDHAAARQELGFVRDAKGKWRRPRSDRAPSTAEREARRAEKEEERLIRKLVSNWFVKIKAIHKGRLSGKRTDAARFAEGRDQILSIRDPLAIPALTGVLSTGSVDARLLMVEALHAFPEDEATMNLLVASLLDPSEDVRLAAAHALAPRQDKRVITRLISALYSDEEALLRNAAVTLGILKSPAAINDLVNVLSKEVRAKVLVSRPAFLDGVRGDFGGFHRYHRDRMLLRYQPSNIGVLGPGTMIGTVSYTEVQTITIHRTEVQEALIAITGQNFGFDADAWRSWWMQQNR